MSKWNRFVYLCLIYTVLIYSIFCQVNGNKAHLLDNLLIGKVEILSKYSYSGFIIGMRRYLMKIISSYFTQSFFSIN